MSNPTAWPELMKITTTQGLYEILIAAKNEWNARAERGETCGPDDGPERPMKRAYLHFENQVVGETCACKEPNKLGAHGIFACTVRE
jgi:hypothetical protein